jgi:hypothetical protein
MALVSVTRLRLRSFRFLPQFLWYSFLSIRQAKSSPGNLTTSTRVNGLSVFWTLTVWRDEQSMKAFRNSGPHKQVMPSLAEWANEASVLHWHQETDSMPSWEEAYRRMETEGRITRVKYPSPAQLVKQS